MNNFCRSMMLISLMMQGENLFASDKKLALQKPFKTAYHKDFDLEVSCSSSDELDTPPRLSQPKHTVLQRAADTQESKKSSPLQRLTVKQIEDIDTKVIYSLVDEYLSFDEDSSGSDFTQLRSGAIVPSSQQSSWCDDLSSNSGDEKDFEEDQELLSTSRFIYPNTSEVKSYVPRDSYELKYIEDKDL